MTALELWCLAMIGLVFEALLAYVVVLLGLLREKTCQVQSLYLINLSVVCQTILEGEKQQLRGGGKGGGREKKYWRLELILFSWVILSLQHLNYGFVTGYFLKI